MDFKLFGNDLIMMVRVPDWAVVHFNQYEKVKTKTNNKLFVHLILCGDYWLLPILTFCFGFFVLSKLWQCTICEDFENLRLYLSNFSLCNPGYLYSYVHTFPTTSKKAADKKK